MPGKIRSILKWGLVPLMVLAFLFVQKPINTTPEAPQKVFAATTPDYGGYRPNYQGFGAQTLGGRTGGNRVCHINTLNISGTPTWGSSGDVKDCLQGLPAGCDAWTGSQAACARYVISDVSGYTGAGLGNTLQIDITGPYLTFAGQTAPSCNEGSGSSGCASGAGGLTFVGVRLVVDTHDVVLQHFRTRTMQGHQGPWGYDTGVECNGIGCSLLNCIICIGESNDDGDNSHVYNNVVDHVTWSWSGGGTSSLTIGQKGGANNVLVTDSLSGEPFDIGTSSAGGYHISAQADPVCKLTIARNAFIDAWGRPPALGTPCQAAVYNNIIYNGTDNTGLTGGQIYGQFNVGNRADNLGLVGIGEFAFTNNAVIKGPNSGNPAGFLALSINTYNIYGDYWTPPAGVKIYLNGNTGPGVTGSTGNGQWTGMYTGNAWPPDQGYGGNDNAVTAGVNSNVRDDELSDWRNNWYYNFNFAQIANTNNAVRDYVLAHAGARPTDRDAADNRMIADVLAGTGNHYINWDYIQSHFGGLPPLVQRTRVLTPPANPNAVASGESFRTNMDVWLESYAKAVEGTGTIPTPNPVPPPGPTPTPTPTPTPPGYTLTPSATNVAPGAQISVTWTAPAGSSTSDWINIARKASSPDVYLAWIYTNGATSGTFTTTAPSTADQYEFRYLLNDTSTIAQRSATVTVGAVQTPGDLNTDHIVNSIDWSIMNSKWFTSDATADLNHDGIVNAIDYSTLNSNWFKTW